MYDSSIACKYRASHQHCAVIQPDTESLCKTHAACAHSTGGHEECTDALSAECRCSTCVCPSNVWSGSPLPHSACREHMQKRHAKNTCRGYMQRTHAENTCKKHMQRTHAENTHLVPAMLNLPGSTGTKARTAPQECLCHACHPSSPAAAAC